MADKTALQLRENGYFVNSDSGTLTFDGYLSIVGRAKDLIILVVTMFIQWKLTICLTE